MKNGVIMDIRGRKAVVLTPDGEFTTINLKRNHTLTIGSEIKLTPKPLNKKKGYFTPSMPTLAGMAAILLLVVIVTGVIPVRQNDAVAAYVSFDINPSIEVGVNSDLEVVQYQAWNSDGEGLNLDQEVTNMSLSEFGGLLVSKLDKEGYLTEDRKLLIVASNVEKKERYQAIKDQLENTIQGIEQNEALVNQAVAITTILDTDYSTRAKAIENGITPGKYMTYLAAVDRGATLSIEDVRNLSVKNMDELETESMTAVESKSKDRSLELEDSVVQLNDKTVPNQNREDSDLVLQEPEQSSSDKVEKVEKEQKDTPSEQETSPSDQTEDSKDNNKVQKDKIEKNEDKSNSIIAKEQDKEKKES
ncbi:anti-sigma factor domain-containing protein [Pseudalkalibacillus sp. NRS-1564]|uniref:anti-sigma factor domain-containing protein n=1 Tax=Pseudalkalibacillus sp. NRS-1564 TaxID=3233900 RepID=UPI003D2B6DB4